MTNPANALAKLLAQIIDDRGRIQIPGFYDDVVPVSDRERQQFAALPFDEAHYMEQIGVDALTGEAGYSTLERRWVRPTFDVNGLWGGYQGEGGKTVLPIQGGGQIQLPPGAQPGRGQGRPRTAAVARAALPAGDQVRVAGLARRPAVMVPLDSPYVEAAARAIEHAFGRKPVYTREGGSIPIVSSFHESLHADTLLLGWGQDDDNTHSPNEKFSLADFHRGIRAARLWRELAAVRR